MSGQRTTTAGSIPIDPNAINAISQASHRASGGKTHSHDIRIAVWSVIISFASVYSLLLPYRTAGDFFPQGRLNTFLHDVRVININGSVPPALLVLALTALCIPAVQAFAGTTRRTRLLAALGGAGVSWSITFSGMGRIRVGKAFADAAPDFGFRVFSAIYQGIRWLSVAALFTVLIAWMFQRICRHQNSSNQVDASDNEASRGLFPRVWASLWRGLSWSEGLYHSFTASHVMIITGTMLLCWIPWIIMMAPANIAADTVAQLVWMRTGKAWDPSTRLDLPAQYHLSDQHPWFDSLMYGAFDHLGLAVGNEALGLMLLAIVHVIAITAALGITISYLGGRLGVSWRLCLVITAGYALIPVFGRLSMSVVKDLTFMPFYLLWSVLYVEYIRRVQREERLGWRFLLAFYCLAMLCGLTKKLGIYVIVAALVVLLVFMHKRIITAMLIIALGASTLAVPKIVYPQLHVAPGGVQEMIALPLQQGVATLIRHGDEMTESERDAITAVFSCPMDDIEHRFTTDASDPVKDCYDRKTTSKNLMAFMKVWAVQGLRHPKTYFESTIWTLKPFVLDGAYDEGFFVRWGWPEKGGNMILPEYKEYEKSAPQQVGASVYSIMENTPVIGVLMREGVYTLWLPLLALLACLAQRRYRNLLFLTPAMLTVCTMAVQPMHQFRYSWPLAFGMALIIAAPFIGETMTKRPETQPIE